MMQDIHGGILGGAASSTGAGQIFADRRLRPHSHHHLHHHQALKCPRCDSLNTKFCYYNNYNLSQPRHFCKNCRRYWTKGGVLRNVPVGGGCRKSSKRSSSSSSKSKVSPPSPPAPAAEGGVTAAAEQKKPSSRSSSESTSHVKSNSNNKLAAATTAQSGLNVNFMNSSNIQSSDPIMMSTATATTTSDAGSACSPSPLFKFSDHTSAVDGTRWSFESLIAVDHGPAPSAMDQCGSGGGGIFAEIGSLMNLMNASNSNTGSGGVNDHQQQQQNHHQQQQQQQQQLLLELFGGTGSSGAANHHLAPFRLQYHQNAADHQNNWPPLSEKNIGGGILDQTSTGHVNFFQERPTSGAVLDSFFDLTGNSTVLDVSGGGGGVMVDSSRHQHDDHIHTSYWGSTQTTTSSQWPQHHDENNQYNQLYLPP